jgi:WhiB family redox-sensing transcriptional regulator
MPEPLAITGSVPERLNGSVPERLNGLNGSVPIGAGATPGPAAPSPLSSSLAALVAVHRSTQHGERRWQEQANCLGVDPDLFFPERGASTREAKSVCRSCEVQGDCLEYALAHGEKFGIWGGLSERERRRVRRARALERRNAVGA